MKRLIVASLIMVMTMGLSINVLAAEEVEKSSDLISIEEYENTISKIYADYGIGWEIVDSSNALPITREIFDSEIKNAYEECEAYQNQINENKTSILEIEQEDTTITTSPIITPMLMPVKKYIMASYKVSAVSFSVTFRALAQITYNADTGNVMTVHSTDISPSSGINFDDWVDNGSEIKIKGTNWRAYFKGTAYFSYVAPVINVKLSKTIPFDASAPMK